MEYGLAWKAWHSQAHGRQTLEEPRDGCQTSHELRFRGHLVARDELPVHKDDDPLLGEQEERLDDGSSHEEQQYPLFRPRY